MTAREGEEMPTMDNHFSHYIYIYMIENPDM